MLLHLQLSFLVLFSFLSGPVASADSDETKEESDGDEVGDSADTLSFKVTCWTVYFAMLCVLPLKW